MSKSASVLAPSVRRAALLTIALAALVLSDGRVRPAAAANELTTILGETVTSEEGFNLAGQRVSQVRIRMLLDWDEHGQPSVGSTFDVLYGLLYLNGYLVGGSIPQLVVESVDPQTATFVASYTPKSSTVANNSPTYSWEHVVCCEGPVAYTQNGFLEFGTGARWGGEAPMTYTGPLLFHTWLGNPKRIQLEFARPAGGGGVAPTFEGGGPGATIDEQGVLTIQTYPGQGTRDLAVTVRARTGEAYTDVRLLVKVHAPTVEWVASDWSTCSVWCGDGQQARTVVCRELATGAIVDGAQCEEQRGPAPASVQACSGPPCPTYSWLSGAWSECSVTCGDGQQARAVVCTDVTGAIVDDGLCTDARPAQVQGCSQPDPFLPVLVCPEPVVLECEGGGASHDLAASATDGCDGAPLAATCGDGGASFLLGTTAVSCAAVDPQGNAATCESAVTVVDSVPPTLECPPAVVAECTSADGALVAVEAPMAQDACGLVDVTVHPARTFPLGATTLVHAATDAGGNEVSCASSVTVVDTTPPVFDPLTLAPQTLAGTCGAPAAGFVTPSALDACSPVAVTCDTSALAAGQQLVPCTAVDAHGNAATAWVSVDVTAPLRVEVQAPLDDDNLADDITTDADVRNRFKPGHTLRFKVKLFTCDGQDVTETMPVVVRLRVAQGATGEGASLVNDVEDYVGVGDAGGLLALVNRVYQYNLATTAADYPRGQEFQARLTVAYTFAPQVVVGEEDVRLLSK